MEDLRRIAERIDAIVEEIAGFADSRARDDAQELVRLLMDLYGAGLERVLAIAADGSRDAKGLVEALCDDDLVSSLLILHGLHPVDLATRVQRRLGGLQAALEPQGVRLSLTSASESEVRVMLDLGEGHCGSTAASVRSSIERAILDAAPDVRRVEVDEPAHRAPGAALIQIQGLKRAG